MQNCPTSIEKIAIDEKKLYQYVKIAKDDCYKTGGITSMNTCPFQKYVKTIKKDFYCIEVYQCAGFSWTCATSDGGSIEL